MPNNKPAAKQNKLSQKEEMIQDILKLQKNLVKFSADLEVAKEQRSELQEEYKKITGRDFVRNEKRYNKLPAELYLGTGTKDPERHIEAMREAYVQESAKLMEQVLVRAKESQHAEKLKVKIMICEKNAITFK